MPIDPQFYDEILPRLWQGGSHAYFWTDDDGGGQKCTLWQDLLQVPRARLPKVWLERLNCYFGIHPTRQRGADSYTRAKVADIALINCLYAEIDNLQTPEEVQECIDWLLEDMPCRPSLIIWSGGGLHIYWLLDAPFALDSDAARERAILAQRAIVAYIGGDIAVHDLARVLRVPGSINHKPERGGAVCAIRHWQPDDVSTLAELEAMLTKQIADLTTTAAAQAHTSPTADLSRDDADVLEIMFRARRGAEYRALWDGDMSCVGDDHSRADQKLCTGLAWASGRNRDQMDRLFRQSGLMRDKWLRDDYRNATLDKAISSTRTVYDPSKGAAGAVAAAQAAVGAGPGVSQAGGGSAGNSGNPGNSGSSSTPSSSSPAASHTRKRSYPYFIDNGHIMVTGQDKQGNDWEKIVSDFTASISREITTEAGDRLFEIVGEGMRGGSFALTIPAEAMGEPRRLLAMLEGAVGALDPIRAGMTAHIAPAIKKLTDESQLQRIRRYQRTGWKGNTFLVPGREPTDTEIELHGKLVYNLGLGSQPDPQLAMDALAALLAAPGAECATVLLSHLLTGPAARLAGWRDERYILMVRGESGTFKTSVAKAAMCIYGAGFQSDSHLLKLGEGVTRNALMAIATQAHDMPLFIDNYKPNTDTQNGFVSLIHNILEGGEKERLNRNSQLRETKPLNCWPLITGEDVPETDAAALARVLILHFDSSVRQNHGILADAQRLGSHLPWIGATWIDWLEGAGAQAAKTIGQEFDQCRARWITILNKLQPEMVNPMRVATNLAINELAYKLATLHPQWGNMLAPYAASHLAGLLRVAETMAQSTVETAEVTRFLTAIRDLVASGAALLPDRFVNMVSIDRGRVVGWRDTDGSIYLLPKVAMAFAEKQLGIKFNSTTQIGLQLANRKLLQSNDPQRRTRRIRIGSTIPDVWHITKDGFEG